jgi:hypothetical protein
MSAPSDISEWPAEVLDLWWALGQVLYDEGTLTEEEAYSEVDGFFTTWGSE